MIERAWEVVFHQLGLKIVSVVVAVVLWLVVLGSRTEEKMKEVPVEILTAADVVSASELPDKVVFRISGPRAFLRTVLDRREEPIRVNLTQNRPGQATYRFYPELLRLPIGVRVMSIYPETLSLKLESMKRRDVPVRLEVQGAPPEGYRISKTELKPETVRVKGPASRLDSIQEIPTLPMDLSHLKQSEEREVRLDLSRFPQVSLEGATPRVRLEVDALSANYKIKNLEIRVLTDRKYTLHEKNVTLFVRVPPELAQGLDRKKAYGVVDLRGKGKGKYREAFQVTLPEGLTLVRPVPEQLNIDLE